MLHIPGAADFGGEGKIPKNIKQTDWLNQMKNNGCVGCPSARAEGNTHDPRRIRQVPHAGGGVDAARELGPVGSADDRTAAVAWSAGRADARRLGPVASRRVSCRA